MNGDGPIEHLRWQEILDALESPSGLPRQFEEHCERCPACLDLVQDARTLHHRFERARLPQVPESLVEATLSRVLAAPGTEPTAWDRLLAGLRAELEELVARLVGDSLAPSPAVRGASTSASRTLLYETDAYSISLSLDRRAAKVGGTLRGQVVPLTDAVLPEPRRALLHSPDSLAEADLDEVGGFQFDDVPDAEVRLAIIVGARFVHIAPLVLARGGSETVNCDHRSRAPTTLGSRLPRPHGRA